MIEDVRQLLQSRRPFRAKSVAAGAAALAASTVSARQSLAQGAAKAVGLTHAPDNAFPAFDGKPCKAETGERFKA